MIVATIAPDFVIPFCLLAYVMGSIPFGVIAARAKGIDITQVGSGNIGATNVSRALGKRIGALVLLGDALKGTIPVLLARWAFGGSWQPTIVAAVGLFAFLGHLYPFTLGFRGGKGVATGLGVFLALAPVPTLIAAAVFAIVYGIWRLSSLGSLIAASTMPATAALLKFRAPIIALTAVLWVFIVYKHRGNIQRLLAHKETKV